ERVRAVLFTFFQYVEAAFPKVYSETVPDSTFNIQYYLTTRLASNIKWGDQSKTGVGKSKKWIGKINSNQRFGLKYYDANKEEILKDLGKKKGKVLDEEDEKEIEEIADPDDLKEEYDSGYDLEESDYEWLYKPIKAPSSDKGRIRITRSKKLRIKKGKAEREKKSKEEATKRKKNRKHQNRRKKKLEKKRYRSQKNKGAPKKRAMATKRRKGNKVKKRRTKK
ncbi:MAG: hypothetical protein MI919_26060, partial [Holophagales bacterium]|nr:hypothetical protein [Holophagales bacterium]